MRDATIHPVPQILRTEIDLPGTLLQGAVEYAVTLPVTAPRASAVGERVEMVDDNGWMLEVVITKVEVIYRATDSVMPTMLAKRRITMAPWLAWGGKAAVCVRGEFTENEKSWKPCC